MKTRIVLAGLLVSMVVIDVSARQEYDDMYFRGKDREKNKSIEAETAYASAKTKKQKSDEDALSQEEDNSNPTDSYSARNINPEYVSRSNAEKASEDENNYYLQGYSPAPASTYSNNNFNNSSNNFNNGYYNNANWASNGYYGGSRYDYFNRGYGCNYCSPQMSWMITSSPFYSYGYYDPWMTSYYPAYGSSGWSLSFMYGGGYGYGYGNPYYGGYGYPGYYGGNNYYNESPRVVNYGKRPSRHSAVVQPTQRTDTRMRSTLAENATTGSSRNASSSERIRPRQTQDEYYVKPSRRSSVFDNPSQLNSGSRDDGLWSPPQNTQPSRRRESYDPSPSSTPSFSPSTPSPSRGGSGGSSGGSGGGSTPRPRGRD